MEPEWFLSIAAAVDLSAYTHLNRYWSQQVAQIRRLASADDDTRFYYSGMAQVFLSDQLLPDWSERILTADETVEGLLAEAMQQP